MLASIDASEVHVLAGHMLGHAAAVPAKARVIVARTGYQTVAFAQIDAPVDTGQLKGDISVDIDNLSFDAGPSVEHGLYQELGTSEMPAQPYMGPGFDQALPGAIEGAADLGTGII